MPIKKNYYFIFIKECCKTTKQSREMREYWNYIILMMVFDIHKQGFVIGNKLYMDTIINYALP